jgi:hypothetical protein
MKTLLLIPFIVLIACQPSAKKEVDLKALKDEVFALHDEVMPKMGDLRRVRKDLMLQADSIQAVDSAQAAILISASDELNAANEGMMNWMRNFNPNFEGTDEETLNYLNEQKASIEEVNKNMKESLSKGEALLSSN